jgi:hypothetical protein
VCRDFTQHMLDCQYELLVALVSVCNFSCSPGERSVIIVCESSSFQVCCIILNVMFLVYVSNGI